SDVITTFAGVRSLLRCDSRGPTARPREHRIVRHGENLLSIAGGKYTTYRAIAEQAVDLLREIVPGSFDTCRTAMMPLPDHPPPPTGERLTASPAVHAKDVEAACKDEMATSVEDVMRRRTPLALSRHGGAEMARRVAAIMAPLLSWDEAR